MCVALPSDLNTLRKSEATNVSVHYGVVFPTKNVGYAEVSCTPFLLRCSLFRRGSAVQSSMLCNVYTGKEAICETKELVEGLKGF